MGFLTKKESGFTLVEVMVATVVMLFVLFALSNYSVSFIKANAKLERKMEANTISRQITALVHQGQNCKVSLQNVTINTAVNSATNFSELYYGIKNPSNQYVRASTPAYRAGEVYGKIELGAMDILVRERVSQSPPRYLANIRFSISETIERQQYQTPEIPVILTTDTSNRVVFCNTVDQNENMVQEKVCDFVGGGLYLYDPVSGTCVPNPDISFEWTDGSSAIATCPAGSLIHPGSAFDACGVRNPSGHVDSFVQPPRRYLSGFEYDRPPRHVQFSKDPASRSCRCDYAIDLSMPASAYQCRVQCFRP